MEEILDIIIKVLAGMLALGAAWLGKYVVSWLKSKMTEKSSAKLDSFVAELVAAAEQLYKEEDIDGKMRLNYVESMLIQAGYEITNVVKALIESKVYEINLNNKEVQTK